MSVISPEMRAILQTQLVSAGTDFSTMDIREARLAFAAAAAGWNVPLPDLDSDNTVLDGVPCRTIHIHAQSIAVGIYLFITSWNEYLFAFVLAGEQVRTVTVAPQMFIGENGIDWGLLMAGGTLVGLPATVLFLLVQRKLVGGLTAGAVKG